MDRRGFLGSLAAFVAAPFVPKAPVVWHNRLLTFQPPPTVQFSPVVAPRFSDDMLYFFHPNGVYRVGANELGAMTLAEVTSPAR